MSMGPPSDPSSKTPSSIKGLEKMSTGVGQAIADAIIEDTHEPVVTHKRKSARQMGDASRISKKHKNDGCGYSSDSSQGVTDTEVTSRLQIQNPSSSSAAPSTHSYSHVFSEISNPTNKIPLSSVQAQGQAATSATDPAEKVNTPAVNPSVTTQETKKTTSPKFLVLRDIPETSTNLTQLEHELSAWNIEYIGIQRLSEKAAPYIPITPNQSGYIVYFRNHYLGTVSMDAARGKLHTLTKKKLQSSTAISAGLPLTNPKAFDVSFKDLFVEGNLYTKEYLLIEDGGLEDVLEDTVFIFFPHDRKTGSVSSATFRKAFWDLENRSKLCNSVTVYRHSSGIYVVGDRYIRNLFLKWFLKHESSAKGIPVFRYKTNEEKKKEEDELEKRKKALAEAKKDGKPAPVYKAPDPKLYLTGRYLTEMHWCKSANDLRSQSAPNAATSQIASANFDSVNSSTVNQPSSGQVTMTNSGPSGTSNFDAIYQQHPNELEAALSHGESSNAGNRKQDAQQGVSNKRADRKARFKNLLEVNDALKKSSSGAPSKQFHKTTSGGHPSDNSSSPGNHNSAMHLGACNQKSDARSDYPFEEERDSFNSYSSGASGTLSRKTNGAGQSSEKSTKIKSRPEIIDLTGDSD